MDPEDEAPRAATPGWPQPHPSPPLPPPREYGAPGTPPDRRPWLWGGLAVAVVTALVTVGLVVLLPGAGDDGSGADAGTQATTSATVSPTASTGSPPATPAPYRCWDGSDAQALDDCSRPTGAEGLRWLFPHLADQRCGAPAKTGTGVVLRILCTARLSDGSRIQLGYYQWTSVRTGIAFYDDQELVTADRGGFRYWTGRSKNTIKAALLYVDAPFSLTWTVPAGAESEPSDLELVKPRPPEEVRGTPVG